MKKIGCMLSASLFMAMSLSAKTVEVKTFNHYGPFKVTNPVVIDSLDVNSSAFNERSLLDYQKSINRKNPVKFTSNGIAPGNDNEKAFHVLEFSFDNKNFAKANLQIEGLKEYRLMVDGEIAKAGELKLEPSTHTVSIGYISYPGKTDSLSVNVNCNDGADIKLREDNSRMLSMADLQHGKRITGGKVSADGKFAIEQIKTTRRGGASQVVSRVISLADNRVVGERAGVVGWMPRSTKYYYVENGVKGRNIVVSDPNTGISEIFAENVPDGNFIVSPDEKNLIMTVYTNGPKEDAEIYQILTPNDRQPGWRNRASVAVFDVETGLYQPLTFGKRNVDVADVSADGKKLLLSIKNERLGKRPTELYTLAVLDMPTMKLDTLVEEDGFISGGCFSPDSKKVLIKGSPEALGGIGKNLPADRTPSMYDVQLFMKDVADRNVIALTKNLNPSVADVEWSVFDKQIYIRTNEGDGSTVYRINPANGKISKLNLPEENVGSFSLASSAPVAVWVGQSSSNPNRLYSYNTKTQRSQQIDDVFEEQFGNVEIANCHEWSFVNEKGDSILGRYYLPVDFDAEKKYPLIVYYYGGCTPVSRTFEGRYPFNLYAAQGFVVYVVQPSGALGFGQEFSSRHVNTAGQGVAEDIIEGTKKFCEAHKFIDSSKIGCLGASYGGFMTQYLQTVTDMFAAAISHAGISDHTSYWGEGYWGYSYSEVSMANSYPWSDSELYVKQSPLYNADKVKTPLLFLHGDADVNVPVGESIQMFTALKLLGKETAFVAVADQDHHIVDYNKFRKWTNTILAWFSKYLKDDPQWWNELYPEKNV